MPFRPIRKSNFVTADWSHISWYMGFSFSFFNQLKYSYNIISFIIVSYLMGGYFGHGDDELSLLAADVST